VCPLLLVPLCAGLAVPFARGTLWADLPADWLSAAAILLLGAPAFAVVHSLHGTGAPLRGGDRTVLLLVAGLVAAGGCVIHRLRPWAAAAGAAVILAALPWPGAGGALPLVVVTAVPLAVLIADAFVGVTVAERPHPLLRAALVVPVLMLTVVGALFVPLRAPTLPHTALAEWMTTPAAPTAPLAVPAELWGDLVREGVAPDRLHLGESVAGGAADWMVATGKIGTDPRAVARFGSGAGALTVLGPAGRDDEAAAEQAAHRAVAEQERAARLALGPDLAASSRLDAPPAVLGTLQAGNVDVRLLRGLTELTATHAVSIAALPAAAGEDPSGALPHAALVTGLDGRSTTNPAVARRLSTSLSAPSAPWVPSAVTPDPSGVVVVW
jgi:putative peptide zinc metalloprotease protein